MEDIFKEASIKKEKLHREFAELPETIITGVVGARDAVGNKRGAGKVPGDEYWSLKLSLIAWKELGKKINNSPLIFSNDLTYSELKLIQDHVERESLVQFKVKLSKESPFGDARAQLLSILDTPDDIELKAALEKYKEPVEVTHPEFGVLVLDRSLDCFEGTINWQGEPVELSVSVDEEDGSISSSLKTIEALYSQSGDWSKKIADYAVSELLEVMNKNWLEGEKEFTASDFINSMELLFITVYPDGKFEFRHDDGDMFLGHSIIISGSLTDGLSEAGISG
ncbi:DUF2262 domain-containing protein [Microbulbifer sp. 2304DJ12-6]|uniref:DUF2262 domain-containing protein n=1 Tax=Microbulbifer sp. 2304DJ12-6 TaxID=3233340 RepID=UPI0039AFF3FB